MYYITFRLKDSWNRDNCSKIELLLQLMKLYFEGHVLLHWNEDLFTKLGLFFRCYQFFFSRGFGCVYFRKQVDLILARVVVMNQNIQITHYLRLKYPNRFLLNLELLWSYWVLRVLHVANIYAFRNAWCWYSIRPG